MKFFFLLFLFSIFFLSCNKVHIFNKNIEDKNYNILMKEDKIKFIFFSKLKGGGCGEYSYPVHFEVLIPNKLVAYYFITDSEYTFILKDREVISITFTYKKNKNLKNWELAICDKDYCGGYGDFDVFKNKVLDGCKHRGFNKFISLKNKYNSFVLTKNFEHNVAYYNLKDEYLYTSPKNNNIEVFFYNIKKENLNNYVEMLKTFKLIK